MDKKFPVTIKGGEMTMMNKQSFIESIKVTKDGEYYLVLKKKRKTRSNQQNRYLWGVVYKLIASELGYTDEEVHDHMKWRFLQKKGGKLRTVRSTTDLNTIEMSEYLENIKSFASLHLNLYIPDPNEVDYD